MDTTRAPKIRTIYTSKRFEVRKIYPENLNHSDDAEMQIESGLEVIDHEGAFQVTHWTYEEADALSQALKHLRRIRSAKWEIDLYLENAIGLGEFQIDSETTELFGQ